MNKLNITWRDVLDSEKLPWQKIEKTNKYICDHTDYEYFCFNGRVFKTGLPFDIIDAFTGLILDWKSGEFRERTEEEKEYR